MRRGLARTHQINTLLNETSARDNVAIAIAERDGIAWRMLRFTKEWRRLSRGSGLRGCRNSGSPTSATGASRSLPYGQQRLLEIAIALALKPRVLLFDEPAAGVPAAEAHVIHDALERLPARSRS